ncbi:MAG: hypothetical protein KGZ61_09355 [Sandarakinorhabdus sp.]|nr:hypothetical protein [Sandarakinorhabdus sp.]
MKIRKRRSGLERGGRQGRILRKRTAMSRPGCNKHRSEKHSPEDHCGHRPGLPAARKKIN